MNNLRPSDPCLVYQTLHVGGALQIYKRAVLVQEKRGAAMIVKDGSACYFTVGHWVQGVLDDSATLAEPIFSRLHDDPEDFSLWHEYRAANTEMNLIGVADWFHTETYGLWGFIETEGGKFHVGFSEEKDWLLYKLRWVNG